MSPYVVSQFATSRKLNGGRIIAGRRLLLRGLQGDDRVGQLLALRDQRCGQRLAVALERPPRLPGPLALIGQRVRIPLGLLDLRPARSGTSPAPRRLS